MQAKESKSLKFLVEIVVTMISGPDVSLQDLIDSKLVTKCLEKMMVLYPVVLQDYAGIILCQLDEKYPNEFDSLISPQLYGFYLRLGPKLKKYKETCESMKKACNLSIDNIKEKLEPKDLELVFEEGYESYDQLSLETSSQCSSDFDFVEKEEIPEDIFIDIEAADQKDDNCVIF